MNSGVKFIVVYTKYLTNLMLLVLQIPWKISQANNKRSYPYS